MKKIIINILFISFSITLITILINKYIISKGWENKYRTQLSQINFSSEKKIEIAVKYLNHAKKLDNIEEIINACKILSDIYRSKYDFQNSLKYLLNAYILSKDRADNKDIADICYKISFIYLDYGDYINAYKYAVRVDSIETKFKIRSAETLNLLGNIYEKSGMYIKSLAAYYESLELQTENNNQEGIANSYHNLANLYMIGDRFDKAYTFYMKSLEIYQMLIEKSNSTKLQIGYAKIYMSLGSYYSIVNDSSNALLYLNKARLSFDKTDNKICIAQALFQMGNFYFQRKDYQKAQANYLKSLDINKSISNHMGLIAASSNLARIYFINHETGKAIETLKNSLNLAIQTGAKQYVAELSEMLYNVFLTGFPDSTEQTKQYASLFFKFKNFLPNIELRDSIIQLSIKHEVTLQKNKEIELEKSRKKQMMIFLLSLLILAIISSIFMLYITRIKNKRIHEKKLAQEQLTRFRAVFDAIENERKRIAIDLHDSVGQMLSTTKLYLSGIGEFEATFDEKKRKAYQDAIELIDESCSELRNISYNIMPGSFIKFGLIAAINELAGRINDSEKIHVDFSYDGFNNLKSENIEIAIYRVVQESLNNILKHANASRIILILKYENNKLFLSIHDNGKGMENIEFYKNEGLGWKSIYTRVLMLNGKIDVDTAINKGTKIDISIPFFDIFEK